MKSNKRGARKTPRRETVVTPINLAIIDQKCAMEMICNFVISQRNHDYNFVMKLFFISQRTHVILSYSMFSTADIVSNKEERELAGACIVLVPGLQ